MPKFGTAIGRHDFLSACTLPIVGPERWLNRRCPWLVHPYSSSEFGALDTILA